VAAAEMQHYLSLYQRQELRAKLLPVTNILTSLLVQQFLLHEPEINILYEISVIRRYAVDAFALLGCEAAYTGYRRFVFIHFFYSTTFHGS
jgi:hypothetical protein